MTEIRKIKFLIGGVVFISVLYSAIYFFSIIYPVKVQLPENAEDENVQYCIDEQMNNPRSFFIKGWIIVKGEDSKNVNYQLLCQNEKTGNTYAIKTFSTQRKDVTKYMQDGKKYDYSGFNSKIIKFMLPDKGMYKLYMLFRAPQGQRLVLLPNTFINE